MQADDFSISMTIRIALRVLVEFLHHLSLFWRLEKDFLSEIKKNPLSCKARGLAPT